MLSVAVVAGATGTTEASNDEVIEFSYLRPVWGPATYEKGNPFEVAMFEECGCDIDVQIVPVIDFNSVFPTLVAGGSMKDVMWHPGPQTGVSSELIEQGAFLALNEYLEQYPAVYEAIGPGLWDLTRSPDGKNYFFPNPSSKIAPFPIYYRADVFDELGIEEPSTIEEFVNALKVIRDYRPDLIPLTAREYTLWYFQNIGVAFGYGYGNWISDPDDPDRIIPSLAGPGHRDFLEWMQMLRREELIDPDYLIATGARGEDKFKAGQAVTMVGNWWGYADWTAALVKNVPDARVDVLYDLTGPAGSMGAVALPGFDRGFSIAADSADKADEIFRFLDWYYTDGYEFMRWGVEGEMFQYNDEGERIRIPDDQRQIGYRSPNVEPLFFPSKAADSIPDWDGAMQSFFASLGYGHKVDLVRDVFEYSAENAMPNYNRMTFSPTEAELGGQIVEQYIRPMQERIAIDPNASMELFDQALADWLRSGGEQIIEEVNTIQTDKSRPRL